MIYKQNKLFNSIIYGLGTENLTNAAAVFSISMAIFRSGWFIEEIETRWIKKKTKILFVSEQNWNRISLLDIRCRCRRGVDNREAIFDKMSLEKSITWHNKFSVIKLLFCPGSRNFYCLEIKWKIKDVTTFTTRWAKVRGKLQQYCSGIPVSYLIRWLLISYLL